MVSPEFPEFPYGVPGIPFLCVLMASALVVGVFCVKGQCHGFRRLPIGSIRGLRELLRGQVELPEDCRLIQAVASPMALDPMVVHAAVWVPRESVGAVAEQCHGVYDRLLGSKDLWLLSGHVAHEADTDSQCTEQDVLAPNAWTLQLHVRTDGAGVLFLRR